MSELSTIQEIRDLAVKGYSKEEISEKLKMASWKIQGVLSVLGFGYQKKNVFAGSSKMMSDVGQLTFTIPLGIREELGMKEGKRYSFTAKVVGEKVQLTFEKE